MEDSLLEENVLISSIRIKKSQLKFSAEGIKRIFVAVYSVGKGTDETTSQSVAGN